MTKVTIKKEKKETETTEVDVSFPYYYSYDFSPDPHSRPHYVRVEENGVKTMVSGPGCCGDKEWELSVEKVDIASHLGYVMASHDYYTYDSPAAKFDETVAEMKAMLGWQ